MSGPDLDHVSLLWPAGSQRRSAPAPLAEHTRADLHLSELIEAMLDPAGSPPQLDRRRRAIRQVLTELCTDPATITYRQHTIQDLLDDPALQAQLAALLPGLEGLADITVVGERYRPTSPPSIERIGRRLADLELLVEVVGQLASALQPGSIQSPALRRCRDLLDQLRRSEAFQALEADLPELRALLATVRSVTIGVNLGPDLRPESATILGFSGERIEGRQPLLSRLLGRSATMHGIAPLHKGETNPLGRPNDLVRDLERLLQQVAAPVATALARYQSVSVQALGGLGAELGVLLGGVRLIQRLQAAGLPTCRPEMLPMEQRITQLTDAYDPGLVLSQDQRDGTQVVCNPVSCGPDEARVWVLTGPNRSGKTTYVRTLGLAHVLAQAGLHVPARACRLSPVDAIFSHFPAPEASQPGMGRLDQEAERLAAIFHQATPHSLILLNEALAGTSTFEALDLAQGVVRGLRALGARAIYVTHVHELAAGVAHINASTPGDAVVGSLVAEPGAERRADQVGLLRTFAIRPGPPHGRSFASEIAEQHGISFSQVLKLLQQRGIQ